MFEIGEVDSVHAQPRQHMRYRRCQKPMTCRRCGRDRSNGTRGGATGRRTRSDHRGREGRLQLLDQLGVRGFGVALPNPFDSAADQLVRQYQRLVEGLHRKRDVRLAIEPKRFPTSADSPDEADQIHGRFPKRCAFNRHEQQLGKNRCTPAIFAVGGSFTHLLHAGVGQEEPMGGADLDAGSGDASGRSVPGRSHSSPKEQTKSPIEQPGGRSDLMASSRDRRGGHRLHRSRYP